MKPDPSARRCRVARARLVVLCVMLGSCLRLSSPRAAESTELPMAAMSFDGKGVLEYPGVPEYQLTSGIIELWFRAGWDAADVERDPDALLGSSCLITCSDGTVRTRYGIALSERLDGLEFWSERQADVVPFPFVRDRWYHLAAVMTADRTTFFVDGWAIGTAQLGPARKWPGQRFDLLIGAGPGETHMFFGEIANVRIWDRPLPLSVMRSLPTYYGQPEDPEVAAALVAFTDWSTRADGRQMLTVDPHVFTEDIAARKAMALFRTQVSWQTSRERAMTSAKADGKLVLAYVTSAEGIDPAARMAERSSLESDWWPELVKPYSTLLLTARRDDPTPMGIPAGQCALLTPEGELLCTFTPWSKRHASAILAAVAASRSAPEGPAARMRALTLKTLGRDDPEAIEALRGLRRTMAADRDTLLGLEADQQIALAEVRRFMERYRSGADLERGAGVIRFEDAHRDYVTQALELFLALPYAPGPEASLTEFAMLVWEAAIDAPDSILMTNVANFVLPLTTIDPALAAYVAAVTPSEYLVRIEGSPGP